MIPHSTVDLFSCGKFINFDIKIEVEVEIKIEKGL